MILDLTIENLLKSGLNIQDATELFNTTNTHVLQCNSGNFYVSKTENKFYTEIDFYRITYFNNGSLSFPIRCVDLVPEYFDLALNEFLEKQKTILGILYNKTDQFNKFISNEIESIQQRIESQKEFIVKMKHHKFESKENDIKICESYINYLKAKQLKAVIPDEVKKELHNHIFKYNAFEIFETYKEKREITVSSRTDLRVIFDLLKEDNLFVETVDLKHYIKWINKEYFTNSITELRIQDLKAKPNIIRANDYKEIKESTLKKPLNR